MNWSDKFKSLGFTVLLYIVHFGINWVISRSNRKEVFKDLRELSTRFAFIGISLFISGLLKPASMFNQTFKAQAKAEAAVFCILLFFIFDGLAIWTSKTYEKQLRSRKAEQIWMLALSHILGVVALSAGFLLS
jgi:hypothetical protein